MQAQLLKPGTSPDNPRIQSLTREIEELEGSFDRWTKAYLVVLCVAAVIGLATIFAQYKTVAIAQVQSKKQKQLDSEKDRQLASDLAEKDLRIRRLGGKASQLQSDLDASTEQARLKAAELKRDNLATEQRLIDAQEALGKETDRRLALEAGLAPRELPYRAFFDGTTNVDDLKPFKGIDADVEYIDDAEARQFAYNIAFLLHEAGWKVSAPKRSSETPWDGVTIRHYLAPAPLTSDQTPKLFFSSDAAHSLERLVREHGFDASRIGAASVEHARITGDTPGWVKVLVGVRPYPYEKTPEELERQREEDVRDGVVRNRPLKPIREEIVPGVENSIRRIRHFAKPTP